MRTIQILLLLCLPLLGYSQQIDNKLEEKIRNEIKGFPGEIGIYVQQLKTQKTVAIDADSIFPTASIIKVPILVGIFQQIAEGKLQLETPYRYTENRIYGGSGLMQFYKDSTQTDLSTMISLMLTYSDNVASIWLQELAGGGTQINPLMDQLGLKNTKVNSKTVGREQQWQQYGWGQTTAKEMATLFTLIRNGQVIDKRYADKMYRYLKNQYYNERSLSQFPSTVNSISKTGSVNQARGEVVLINAPHGDIVFCILTKNNKDESWSDTNQAEVLTRKIANIIWNHYEPQDKFTPYPKIN